MNLAGATFFRYSFSGAADGAYPYAPVIQARNGLLYGTVYAGDFSTHGRVFRLAGTHRLRRAYVRPHRHRRSQSLSALVEGADGNFYGTTHFGGAFDQGTAFRMTPAGAVTVVKSFTGGADGAFPDTALIQPRDGNFYGAAKVGGASGYGTLYKMTPSGVVTVLHTFNGGAMARTPPPPSSRRPRAGLYGTHGRRRPVGKRRRVSAGDDDCGAAPGDFDGDGKADLTVFRPSTGIWFIRTRAGEPTMHAWGNSGDMPVAGDYDGDGQTDVAVFRPSTGTWFIR